MSRPRVTEVGRITGQVYRDCVGAVGVGFHRREGLDNGMLLLSEFGAIGEIRTWPPSWTIKIQGGVEWIEGILRSCRVQ